MARKTTLIIITITVGILFIVTGVLAIALKSSSSSSSSSSTDDAAAAAAAAKPLRRRRFATDLASETEARAALSGAEPAMVFIHMDNCGFCKRANPIYNELAADPAYGHVKLLKLNAKHASKLASEHKIRGFPAFLTNWMDTPIMGYKPKSDMEIFLKKAPLRNANSKGMRVTASSSFITDEKLVMSALKDDREPSLVFVSADWCGFCKKLQPIWDNVVASGRFNNVRALQIDSKHAPELIKQHGITGFPVLLSNRGKKKYVGYRPQDQLEMVFEEIRK